MMPRTIGIILLGAVAWVTKLILEREYDHIAGKLAPSLARLAVRLLPSVERERYEEEWFAELSEAAADQSGATGFGWTLTLPFAGLLNRARFHAQLLRSQLPAGTSLPEVSIVAFLTMPALVLSGRSVWSAACWLLSGVLVILRRAASGEERSLPRVFAATALAVGVVQAATGTHVDMAVVVGLTVGLVAGVFRRAVLFAARFGTFAAAQTCTLGMMVLHGSTRTPDWQLQNLLTGARYAAVFATMTGPVLVGSVLGGRRNSRLAALGGFAGGLAYAVPAAVLSDFDALSVVMLVLWPLIGSLLSRQVTATGGLTVGWIHWNEGTVTKAGAARRNAE